MIKITKYTENPLITMGNKAGFCYNTTNEKLFRRIAVQCLDENHGRVQEFPEIQFEFSEYSAKVIREIGRHVHLTFLQSSTRYIDYTNQFDYAVPPSVKKNKEAFKFWQENMVNVSKTMNKMKELGVPVEDFSNVLPLAYHTKGVFKIGLRELIHMFGVRSCSCAYHEARVFMSDIKKAVKSLGNEEWTYLADNYFVPKCDRNLFCDELKRWHLCKRHPKKTQVKDWIEQMKKTTDWRN